MEEKDAPGMSAMSSSRLAADREASSILLAQVSKRYASPCLSFSLFWFSNREK
jgi:hypothetical protein